MEKKNKTDWRVICVGMVCLTAAELYALSLGFNGYLLTAFMATMAGFIGLKIETPNILKK